MLSVGCERPVEAFELFDQHPLLFEPGSKYHYSKYGWVLLSAAVEAAAGEPFMTFMRKRIFEPLDMDDTRSDFADAVAPGQATYYFPRFAEEPRYGYHLMRAIDYSCYSGSSAFLSTPSDLVRFGLAVNGGKLLKPETVRVLQAPQRLASGEETGYGLGWDLETANLAGQPVRVTGHDGDSLGGMVASLLIYREHGIVVAVMSNISYADTYSLATRIAEAFAEPAAGPGRK